MRLRRFPPRKRQDEQPITHPQEGHRPRRNIVLLNGVVTCGSSGAVSSQDCDGFTVTQTGSEDGRFTITLSDTWLKIMNVLSSREISADTAEVQAKGSVP